MKSLILLSLLLMMAGCTKADRINECIDDKMLCLSPIDHVGFNTIVEACQEIYK